MGFLPQLHPSLPAARAGQRGSQRRAVMLWDAVCGQMKINSSLSILRNGGWWHPKKAVMYPHSRELKSGPAKSKGLWWLPSESGRWLGSTSSPRLSVNPVMEVAVAQVSGAGGNRVRSGCSPSLPPCPHCYCVETARRGRGLLHFRERGSLCPQGPEWMEKPLGLHQQKVPSCIPRALPWPASGLFHPSGMG